MLISGLLTVTFLISGVFSQSPYGWFPAFPPSSHGGHHPHQHGPPPFPMEYGPPHGGGRGPPPFAQGRKHGPPPFSHGKGHGHGHGHGYPSYEDDSDSSYYDDSLPPIVPTKRPTIHLTTKQPTNPTIATTTLTTPDYGVGQLDVRFKKPDTDEDSRGKADNDEENRGKRSTEPVNLSPTTEIRERYNSLGHYPLWNTPADPDFKPYFYYPSRLAICVLKKYDCLPIGKCKNPPRINSYHPGFCRWEEDQAYICCEKPKGTNKFQNQPMKCDGRRNGSEYSEAIIGGTSVSGGTGFPWMVAIGEKSSNDSIDWYCGGALVGEKTVLTAAHCISRRKANMIRIGEIDLTVEKIDDNSNVQEISISTTLSHPLYRSPILYNDLALLFLDVAVRFTSFARPICLSSKTSSSGGTPVALLTGWGQLGFANQASSILQQVTVKVFNNSYCDRQYSRTQASKRNFPRGILDTQLCAGDEDGGKDACQGDSGAPLVAEEDGAFVLIGIVSAGIGCGSKTFPGVYTRVSAFAPWIRENII